MKINDRIKNLSNSKKSVLALVGGTTLAQALSFFFSPFQTRLFSPEVFGELAVFTSITGIASIIVCLRYELSIIIPEEDDEGFALLKISIFLAFLMSLASLIVLLFQKYQIFKLFNAINLVNFWYYIPITIFLNGIIQASNYWLTRKREFKILSYNKVVPVLAVNLLSIFLGLVGYRALNSRLFSIIIGSLVNIGLLIKTIVPEFITSRKKHFKTILLLKRYKNFLIFDIWGSLINNISWMIIPILMNYYFGSYFAGQYSIGLRVIQIPASIIGASIGQVFIKEAAEKMHQGLLFDYTIKIAKVLSIYTIPFAILMLIFGKSLFQILFGDKWTIAGIYVQIMSFWSIFWFISSPISIIYTICQKQGYMLLIAIVNIVTRVLSLYIGKMQNDSILGIKIFSASGIIVYLLNLVLILYISKESDRKCRGKK